MFEWDVAKASTNVEKHAVSFEEAATVFGDVSALDAADVGHSSVESRFIRLGRSVLGRVLVVVYTLRRSGNGEAIRIISARRANREERAAYTTTE